MRPVRTLAFPKHVMGRLSGPHHLAETTRFCLFLAPHFLFSLVFENVGYTTGTGALSPDDVGLFRSGYFVCLPKPSGGLVLLVDESRIPRAPGHAKTRIAFYWT